ncbi:hypothetical protein CS022_00125 [Veronia nyctiphanis]|uniref:VanZ-like domain-containing protein n=2 Tax=Veronia nyctiphanis TaxID=1278244 RepID=A0A4V1LTC3_9GAMM|nr:hypothetical protein CS022_00125 [Veronia nyctiphanis]
MALVLTLGVLSLFSNVGLGSLGINGTTFFYGHGDWFFHFALFFIATCWLGLFIPKDYAHVLWCILFVCGIASELVQHFYLVHRDGRWGDAVINTVAILIGILCLKGIAVYKARSSEY